MFKRSGSKLTQAMVLVFLLALFLDVLHLSWGRSLFEATKKLKSDFTARQNELQKQEELIRAVPDPFKAIEDIEKKAEEFKDIEVSKRQVPRLIHMLGRSASERSLNIISIRPRDDIKNTNETLPAGVAKVYVELVMSSSYQLLGEYLADLNKLSVSFII